jgi:GNAT superfamily N-acetyltransferase
MIDVKNFKTSETLKNGMVVTIRAVRPSDKELFVKIFNNLDPETIYTRFFHRKTSLSDTDLKMLTEVDFVHNVGLIAIIPGPEREVIIGVARYALLQTGQEGQLSAEVAFTVEKDYRGQGLASSMLRHIIMIAREQGLKSLEAEVMADNISMFKVFNRSGLPMQTKYPDGGIHVTLLL